jgi:hypothetical protein
MLHRATGWRRWKRQSWIFAPCLSCRAVGELFLGDDPRGSHRPPPPRGSISGDRQSAGIIRQGAAELLRWPCVRASPAPAHPALCSLPFLPPRRITESTSPARTGRTSSAPVTGPDPAERTLPRPTALQLPQPGSVRLPVTAPARPIAAKAGGLPGTVRESQECGTGRSAA